MSGLAEDAAAGLRFLESAAAHGRLAAKVVEVLRVEVPGPAQAFETLREALGDVPRLVEIARQGLLDRALIQQRAGQQERCATVQELHDVVEILRGLVVCGHCSELAGRPIAYPCPTIARHDG